MTSDSCKGDGKPHGEPPGGFLLSLLIRHLVTRRSRHDASEIDGVVGAIAEGFLPRRAAAAEGKTGAAPEGDGPSLGVNQLKIPFDPKTSVAGNDYAAGHSRFTLGS